MLFKKASKNFLEGGGGGAKATNCSIVYKPNNSMCKIC